MKADQNPFRSSAIAELRYRIQPADLSALVARLRASQWRGCILGPEGAGKTTLLEDLVGVATAEGLQVFWIRLTLESSGRERRDAFAQLDQLGAGDCCFFDGGEVLGWFQWRRLIAKARRRGCGLLATVHRSCPLPVVYRTGATLPLALELTAELAGRHWTPGMASVVNAAFHASNGNVREVFRACYWHFAALND